LADSDLFEEIPASTTQSGKIIQVFFRGIVHLSRQLPGLQAFAGPPR
jgi:hypothetical protein